MALEIKGLKGKAVKAGAMFDRLNRAYDKLLVTGEAHAEDVESLPSQIEGMQEDLTFMVQTLGNSVSGSGQQQEQKQPDAPKTEPTALEIKPGMTPEQTRQMIEDTRSPEVGQPATFRGTDDASGDQQRPPQAVLDQAVIVDHLIGEKAAG